MLILFDSITQTVNAAVKGSPLIFLFHLAPREERNEFDWEKKKSSPLSLSL